MDIETAIKLVLSDPEALWKVKTSEQIVGSPWTKKLYSDGMERIASTNNYLADVYLTTRPRRPYPGDFSLGEEDLYSEEKTKYHDLLSRQKPWTFDINAHFYDIKSTNHPLNEFLNILDYADTREEAMGLADAVLAANGILLRN